MDEFRWILMSLFMIGMPHSTVTGQHQRFTVRDGDDVTLPCMHVGDHQGECNRTTCLFSNSTSAVPLFEHGKIQHEARYGSDRLSVTENCSLVLKKVTEEDVGLYACRQFDKTGRQQGEGSMVSLSVVTITSSSSSSKSEHQNHDEVTLICSVRSYDHCRHTVKWMNGSNNVTDMKTSQDTYSITVTFTTSHLNHKFYDLLKCEVTDGDRKQQFTIRRQTGGREMGQINSSDSPYFLTTIIVSVGLSALIISVVTVEMWRRTKGKKTRMEENTVCDDEDEGNYENVAESSASV